MATASKKPKPAHVPPSPKSWKANAVKPDDPWLLRAFDSVYRFLASLKLAVVSISLLAFTLAFGTFFEAWHGTGAVQEWVYQSKAFAVLLAFLGINILCAALIRFPWTKRQTGFVITHAGLLTLLFGSFISVKVADEGHVGMLEGGKASEVIRMNHPVIRVDKVGSGTETVLPFHHGSFAWSPGRIHRLTTAEDHFELVVRNFMPASAPPSLVHEPDPSGRGRPMLKAALLVKPPNAPMEQDFLEMQGGSWLDARHPRLLRETRSAGPVQFAFQYVDGPHVAEKVDDFLHPPKKPLVESFARFHYEDKAGKPRVFEWVADPAAKGKPFVLPESDLTVTFDGLLDVPVGREEDRDGQMEEVLGDDHLHAAQFKVREADGPEVPHYGWASLPMLESMVAPQAPAGSKELVRIGYFQPPHISGEAMQGRYASIEVMATPDKRLYYRAIGRDENDGRNGLRGLGPLTLGRSTPLFGGDKQRMSVTLRADEFLTSGKTREVVEPLVLPKGKMGEGIPAVEATLTADGESKTFWLRRGGDFRPAYETVHLPNGDVYRVAFDFDRKPLGFEFELTDFDVGMDPGTNEPSSYTSEVLLSDEAKNLHQKPATVTMNEPLTHRGWTFYQSNYIPMTDGTGRRTGQFMSVFSARYDPAWQVIYIGCLLIVVGTFVQFYMRSGVFTDRGARERARAARVRNVGASNGETAPAEPVVEAEADDEPL